ncbi:MAG: hypothetical protein KJO51_02175 [Gramella sp.]|nr:hypothetical protein [Christiangramia sp.]
MEQIKRWKLDFKIMIMKTSFLFILVSFLNLQTSVAQSFETDTQAQNNIQKLEFLVGKWEGEGWRILQDGTKHTFSQSENVQFKLDSTALLIEGKGMANNKVIHNAMAIITSNKEPGKYEFQSFLQNGMKGSFKAEIKHETFYWYPNENVRYIIYINDKGEWYEKGEYNRQDNWVQFFEMTLTKS